MKEQYEILIMRSNIFIKYHVVKNVGMGFFQVNVKLLGFIAHL